MTTPTPDPWYVGVLMPVSEHNAEVARLRAEVAAAEQRGAEQARAELGDRYVEQLRRQETVHDACEGHALCDLVAELTRAAVAES